MHKVRISATVSDDHKLIVTLPPEVPSGPVEIDMVIRQSQSAKTNGAVRVDTSSDEPFFCLADWFEGRSEDWGDQIRSDDVEGFTGRRF